MKIYLGSSGKPTTCSGDTEAGVKEIAHLKLNAMEIPFTFGVRLSVPAAKKIGITAKENKVRLSIHAPYFINLCQQDKLKLARSKRNIYESVKMAELLGAKIVVFHPGAYMGLSKEAAMDQMKEVCKELSKKVNVDLGLEVMGKQGQFGSLDEVIEVCKDIKKCVPVVDFGHIFARNAGEIDYNDIFKKLKTLDLDYHHFHFAGINFTKKAAGIGNERNHEPISSNKPPFKPLADFILKSKKDTTIICESPLLEQDSLRMKKIFEEKGYKF